MKNILFVVFFFLLVNDALAQAPAWAWARTAGGSYDDHVMSIATDNAGNVIITGYSESDSISFGTHTLIKPIPWTSGWFFIAKYDPNGNVLWANTTSTGDPSTGWSLVVDKLNNIYVTGGFGSDFTYKGFKIAGDGTLILKLDQNGNLVFGKSINSWRNSGYAIAVDSSANIYIAGLFGDPFIIIGTDTLLNHDSTQTWAEAYIAKFNSLGNPVWAKSFGGIDPLQITSMTLDPANNIYICGFYQGNTIHFGTTTLINTSNSAMAADIYLVKYDVNGNFKWAKSASGNENDYAYSVTTDKSGNVFMTGNFQGDSITFDNNTIIEPANPDYDMFIVKYDVNGNIVWAKKGCDGFGQPGSIIVDNAGYIYISGQVDAYPVTFGALVTQFAFGAFVVKYGAEASPIWLKEVDTWYPVLISKAIMAFDVFGNLFVTGPFSSDPLNFDSLTLAGSSSASEDIYVAKLSSVVGINELSFEKNAIQIYPNPSNNKFTISFSKAMSNASLKIFNMMGQEVYNQTVNDKQQTVNTNLSSGIYFARVRDNEKQYVQKIIVE